MAANKVQTDQYLDPPILESTYYIRDSFRIKEFVFQKTHLLSTPYYILFKTENIIWTLQCVNTETDRRECTMILKLHNKGSKVNNLIKGGISINCSIVKEDSQKQINMTSIIHDFLDEIPTSKKVYQEAYTEDNIGVRSATVLIQIHYVDVLVRGEIQNMTKEVTNVYNTIVFLYRQKIFISNNINQQKTIEFLHKNYDKIANSDDFEKQIRAYVCMATLKSLERVSYDASFSDIWAKAMELEAAKEQENVGEVPPSTCELS